MKDGRAFEEGLLGPSSKPFVHLHPFSPRHPLRWCATSRSGARAPFPRLSRRDSIVRLYLLCGLLGRTTHRAQAVRLCVSKLLPPNNPPRCSRLRELGHVLGQIQIDQVDAPSLRFLSTHLGTSRRSRAPAASRPAERNSSAGIWMRASGAVRPTAGALLAGIRRTRSETCHGVRGGGMGQGISGGRGSGSPALGS